MAYDITDDTAIEETVPFGETQLRQTLDNMLEGMQIIGFDWRYIYVKSPNRYNARNREKEIILNKFLYPFPEQSGILLTNDHILFGRWF